MKFAGRIKIEVYRCCRSYIRYKLYDRAYKSREKVIPEMLTSVFFEYSREAVINLVNNELNTAFTDILCISDNSIDIENTTPICGHI